jgi:hypothetical protein
MTTATGLSPKQLTQRIRSLTATRDKLQANLRDTHTRNSPRSRRSSRAAKQPAGG